MTQCFELTLRAAVDAADFEAFVWTELFPRLQIHQRTVAVTTHRLFKPEGDESAGTYIWLVFATLVGATPETAGEGPQVLAFDVDWLAEATERLAHLATISVFSELPTAAKQRPHRMGE